MGKKKKKTWFSVIKRLFITEPQSRLDNKKDNKRRRWVFRLLKVKDVPGLSTSSAAREMLPWKASSSSTQSHSLAATKIQSAFRGYLARKALAALKGVVKLQALIRGWAVRQQAIKTLKCLQSLVNIQSQVFSKRSSCERLMKDGLHEGFCDQKDINVDLNSQKRWDDSTLTKEEIIALFATKREGCVKRERVKEYYLNHRRSAETERERAYGRRRYWLEEWVDSQLAKSEGPKKKLETRVVSCNGRNREEINGRVRNFEKQYEAEMCESVVPRRSHHHRKQRSIGDEHSFAASPSYMASTESAKAKTRSLSSPRLRPLSFDVCSEISSPYKHKLSPISSINSELTSSSWIGNHVSSPHKSSPCFKGLPGPVKSNMSSKDLRIRGIYHHQS